MIAFVALKIQEFGLSFAEDGIGPIPFSPAARSSTMKNLAIAFRHESLRFRIGAKNVGFRPDLRPGHLAS
jgi:hypothetical protein